MSSIYHYAECSDRIIERIGEALPVRLTTQHKDRLERIILQEFWDMGFIEPELEGDFLKLTKLPAPAAGKTESEVL